MCIYQASTWISNIIRHGLFLCSVVWGERWLYIMLILVELNNWPLMCVSMLISWGQPLHDRLPVGGCSLSLWQMSQYYLLSRMCLILSINHVSLGFFLTSIICYMSQIIVDLFGNKVWFELIKNYKKTACFSFRIGNNSKLYISSSI